MKKRLILLAIACLFFTPAILLAEQNYVAYSIDKEGNKIPLSEKLDGIKDQYLLNVEWGEYGGTKKRVSVLPVENQTKQSTLVANYQGVQTGASPSNNTQSMDIAWTGQQVPVEGLAAMLMDVLNRTGRFRVIERQEIKDVMQEQDFGASGRVASPSSAKIGKILGSQVQVKLEITEYAPNAESKNIGVGAILGKANPILGGVSVKSKKSVVSLNVRLIDAETSEIIFTKQVSGSVVESGLGLGGATSIGDNGAAGGFFSSAKKTQIGQAVIIALNKAAFELIKQVGTAPWEGSVITVKKEEKQIYVNGDNTVLKVGDSLKVSSKGEELIDPDTGLSLGSEKEELGTMAIIKTTDKFSIGTADNNVIEKVKKGDAVQSLAMAEPLAFGPDWDKSGAPPKKKK